MKLRIALSLILVGLTLGCKPKADAPVPATITVKSAIENQHATTHRVGVYDIHAYNTEVGGCSGTAVGPHALLTALHCFSDSNLIRLDKDLKPIVILAAFLDGQDHVIYLLEHDFQHWAGIDERKPEVNEPVHFWGSPGDSADVYRSGYYQKNIKDAPEKIKGKKTEGETFELQVFVLPVFGGDSGSGIFDASGFVIAVVSKGDRSANNYDYPLSFTQEQLDIIISE